MDTILLFLRCFLVGGLLCLLGQLLIDRTGFTPAKILTAYVVAGVILGAVGLYEPLVQWGGSGATVPLTGFGYNLSRGVREAVSQRGWLGALTGGATAAAAGLTAAITFAALTALVFKSGDKS